jgi:beta-glucanase (GH16 family)
MSMEQRTMFAWRSWAVAAVGLGAAAGVAACSPRADAASPAPLARAPDGRALALTFSEDFKTFSRMRSDSPAPAVWRSTFFAGSSGGVQARTIPTNKELQVYVDPEMKDGQGRAMGLNPFDLRDGQLDLIAQPAAPEVRSQIAGLPYTSGMISSQPSFSQLYGYFEAGVKLPRGKGLWPAVWMLPADLSWPPEIDLMESIGNPMQAFMTVHSAKAKTPGIEVHPASEGFHTYAVAWDPKQIVFYLDGVETQRTPTPPDMTKPMYILANLAVGGDWAGSPDSSTPFPARFSIRFIRAYRFTS